MLNERIIVPELAENEQAILDRLVEQLHARQPRNLLRASYYD